MKRKHDNIASKKRKENYSKRWFKESLSLLKREKINIKNVIDIGTGKGEFLEILKTNFSVLSLTGVDYVDADLEILEQKNIKAIKIDLDSFDINSFPALKYKFDLVICLATVEHVFNTDQLFSFFNYLLKEDGNLLISTPNMGSFHYKLFNLLRGYPFGEGHHVRFFNKNKIQRYAFFNGFNIIKWNNYFTFSTEVIRRGLGIKNTFLVYCLGLLFFGPLLILSKLNIFNFFVNNNLMILLRKSDFLPLGFQIDDFHESFNSLSALKKELWIKRIKKYYKKDQLKDTINFKSCIKKIIKQ